MIKVGILIVSVVTILLSIGVAAAGPGFQFGFWDLGTAFKILQTGAPYLVGGAIASLIGLVLGLITRQKGVLFPGLLAIVLSGGLVYSLIGQQADAGANPIHDITTDINNPPAIVAAAGLERRNPAKYVGGDKYGDGNETVSQIQQRLYPDLASSKFPQSVDVVFEAALKTAKSMKFEVLSADKQTGIIETAYTSPWFGFIDDVIIRVKNEGGQTIVDVRSKSRVGGSDLGANAARIKSFQSKLAAGLN